MDIKSAQKMMKYKSNLYKKYISNEINLKIYGLNSKDFEFIFVYFGYFKLIHIVFTI